MKFLESAEATEDELAKVMAMVAIAAGHTHPGVSPPNPAAPPKKRKFSRLPEPTAEFRRSVTEVMKEAGGGLFPKDIEQRLKSDAKFQHFLPDESRLAAWVIRVLSRNPNSYNNLNNGKYMLASLSKK
jgi:hypothetical protein